MSVVPPDDRLNDGLPMLRRLEDAKQRFCRQWQDGPRPDIEVYLRDAREVERSLLLTQLVLLDIDARLKRGEVPQADEYLTRFPDAHELLTTVIDQAVEQEVGSTVDANDQAVEVTRSFRNTGADEQTQTFAPADISNPSPQRSPAAGDKAGSEPAGTRADQPSDYEILEELGRGGMGVVYKARQKSLNRIVALKMILAGKLASEELIQRFHAEAEAAAKLDHPGITAVYQVGRQGSHHFFSMAFVEGRSLAELVQEAPLPPQEAGRLVAQIARAMHYAHQQGVIHRDLKPQNVLLDLEGSPRITDFGLAKLVESDADLTADGQVMGTPAYMAPEQAAGKTSELNRQVDVYSLGAMLYRLIAGRPPFQAATALETLRQVIEQEPISPRELNTAVDRDLETICLKCLQKEPVRRYDTAAALEEDLQRYLRGEPIQARPVSRLERLNRWRKRNRLVANLAIALVAALAVGAAGSSFFAVQSGVRLQRAEYETQRANMNARKANEKTAEAQARAEENSQLLLSQFDERARQEMDDGDLPAAMLWRAKSLEIAGGDRAREELCQVQLSNLLRRCPRLLQVWFYEHSIRCAQFDASGRQILTADGDSVQVFRTSGPGLKIRNARMGAVPQPFNHDGTLVITDSMLAPRIRETKQGQILGTLPNEFNNRFAFSPGGDTLAISSPEEKTVRLHDPRTLLPLGPAMPLSHRVDELRFSADGGKLIAKCPIATASSEIVFHVFNLTANRTEPIVIRPSAHTMQWAVGPRGQRMVLSMLNQGLGIADLVTGEIRPLPKAPLGGVRALAISPNGHYLAAGGDRQVRFWDLHTSRLLSVVLHHDAPVTDVAFSSDSRLVATASDDGAARIWDILRGKLYVPPLWHGGSVRHVEFQPDGSQLLTNEDKIVRLWDLASDDPQTLAWGELAAATKLQTLADGRLLSWTGGEPERGYGIRTWSPSGSSNPLIAMPATPFRFAVDGDDSHVAAEFMDPVPAAEFINLSTGHIEASWCGAESDRLLTSYFSPAGKGRIGVVNDGSKETHFVDAESGTTLFSLPLRAMSVWPSPSGDKLAVLTYDDSHQLQIFSAKDGTPITASQEHEGSSLSVVFSRDSRRFASLEGKAVRLWETATNRPLTPAMTHDRNVKDVVFSPDGSLLAALASTTIWGKEPGRIYLWDTNSGQPAGPVLDTNAVPLCVVFSPDGRWLAAGDSQGSFQVWESRNGMPVTPVIRGGPAIMGAAFSLDGERLVTASGPIRFWRLTADPRPVEHWTDIAEALSGRRIDETGQLRVRPWDPEAWRELRKRLPEVFSSKSSARRNWRLKEAEERMFDKWQSAAIGHLDHAISATPDSWRLYARRGKANLSAKNWTAALQDLTHAIELGADEGSVWFSAAQAHAELKQWQQAADKLTHLANGYSTSHETYQLRGEALAELAQWVAAVKDFEEALAHGRDYDLKVTGALAMAQLGAGDNSACQQTTRRMLTDFDDEEPEVLLHIARTWTITGAGPFIDSTAATTASEIASRAIGDVRNDPHAQVTHGAVLLRAGEVNDAISKLEDVRGGEDAAVGVRASAWLAVAHAKSGKAEAARTHLAAVAKEFVDVGMNWQERLEIETLVREANTMLDESR